jgi:hypothetical protein
MKKILFFTLITFVFHSAFGQSTVGVRRALLEEFTSSSSDLSAVSDPVINQLEGEAAQHFCIVKWYLGKGSAAGANTFYHDYTLSDLRSQFYGNDTVSRMVINGGGKFDPYGLSLDALRATVAPSYTLTSPFTLDITQKVVADSIVATVIVHLLDTTVDLTKLSIGVIVTERYNQTEDVNYIPFHTNIVRTVLPSLDPKAGSIRDALPFAIAMQGVKIQTFRFSAKLGGDWDRYGLACVGVIQNSNTKEVLQCNWTVPEIAFSRPTQSSFILLNGTTPCEFTLKNTTDSDWTVTPQLTHNAPSDWALQLGGLQQPKFILPAHGSMTGTFIATGAPPFRESGDFILLFRVNPGIVVASISGTLVGNDSRDLIIKNWTSSVYKTDPDIQAWKKFGLDAAIVNDDAIGNLFNNNLNRFRTVYVERSNYGSAGDLESIRNYMSIGGRLIFNSGSVNKLFSGSIIDTSVNKYAVNFLSIFHTTPATISPLNWTKGNTVKGPVFSDTLAAPYAVGSRPLEPLIPVDTHHSQPMLIDQHASVTGVSIESSYGKIAYMTFPISAILDPTAASFVMGKILAWFQVPLGVKASEQEVASEVYPNPVTTTATIHYHFPPRSPVTFSLQDELGRVQQVPEQMKGDDQLIIDCSRVAAGVYYYTLRSGDRIAQGKIIIAK